MEDLVKNAPIQAMKNRKSLTNSCGCFKCLAVFDLAEITQWTDGEETAICPKCNADAVLPITDVDVLKSIQRFWFE